MTNSFFKTITARPVSNTFRILQVLFLILAQVGGAIYGVQPALAAPMVAVDDAGADDEPGQKDLNALTVDYGAPGATTINVQWNWDDTATSGANTRDAGALFDTDGDGFANFSLYVTVASNGTWITQLYACSADNRTDRCSGPTLVNTFSSTATVSTVANSDPFGVPSSAYFDPDHVTGNTCDARSGCYTADTVANTTIVLSDFGNPADVTLLNVCSYPSGQPNSDPSDCVFTPNSGFLTIVKNANPSDATNFVFNASAPSASGDTSWTITGSGSVQLISYAATTTLDLNEVVPAGWQLDSASCTLQSGSPTSTGTPTATGIDNLTIQSGVETVCTFNDSPAFVPNPSLTVEKSSTTTSLSAPGTVTYSYLVTNTGNVALTGISLSDNNDNDDMSCPATTLAVGANMTCTATHTFTQAELDAGGSLDNTVTASSNEAPDATDNLSIPISQTASLTIDKTATPATYSAVGQVISYSYLVTNSGNTTLSGPFTVSDDKATDESCPATASLAPGASITCTASYTITQADMDAGSVTNVAFASNGTVTSPTDTETVDAVTNSALSLTKSASPTTYLAAGQVITYTYVIKNTGNVTLSGPFTVNDDKATVTCTQPADGALSPNETMNCTATYTIQPGDLNASGTGSVTNTAVATNGTVTSNQAQATVNQVTATGQIAPTATSCQDFRDGTAGNLTEILYGVKNNKINNVAPGVLFYYSLVTVPAGTHTISVTQTTSPPFTLFGIQKNQAILWSLNCTKVQSNGTGSFTVTNNTATTYIIGIKYNPGTVVGKPKPSGNGQVTYTFTTLIDGVVVPTSPDSLVLKPK